MRERLRARVGDLLVIDTETVGYQLSELSHIDNVLSGEVKERTHRRLRRTEEEVLFESEVLEETERDLQSTERYELHSEVRQLVVKETATEAGVQVSAGYGPFVQVDASASFSSKAASEAEKKASSEYARNVVSRAAERVAERVRQQRVRRTVEETEESNLHTIDNAGGVHVSGVYQWVDKVQSARLMNHGRRLMLEFMIPEPGRHLLSALLERAEADLQAQAPRPMQLVPSDIRVSNYLQLGRFWSAAELPPPPAELAWVSTSFEIPAADKLVTFSKMGSIDVEPGYYAFMARASIVWFAGHELDSTGAHVVLPPDQTVGVEVGVGRERLAFTTEFGADAEGWIWLGGETASVPVAVSCRHQEAFSVIVEVMCLPTLAAYRAWQSDVHSILLEAYRQRQTEYDQRLEEQSFENRSMLAPPAVLRTRERTELQRAVISLLLEDSLDRFGAIGGSAHAIDFDALDQQAPTWRFFDRAFEWEHMTYSLLPYFWAEHERWVELLELGPPLEATHAAFLRAGAARVVVPVQPGAEAEVLHLIDHGVVWNHDEPPELAELGVSEELLDVVAELAEEAASEQEPKAIDEWEVVVPTTLVKLRKDDKVPTTKAELGSDQPPEA